MPSIDDGDWKLLPDGGMEVTWKLRPDVKWHDGTLLSAEDFVLGIQIAREGREGRRIGTLFTVGAETEVLQRSRCLILDPLSGQPPSQRSIHDPDVRETVKELAQVDGGFVISGQGTALSACRRS